MFASLATNGSGVGIFGLATSISEHQRFAISSVLNKVCAGVSQEAQPRVAAGIATEVIHSYLTGSNLKMLKHFRESNSPYLLLKGAIDTEGLPPTPIDDVPPEERLWRSQAIALLGYLKLCGANAHSFEDEMEGRLFHMVMPAKNGVVSQLRSTKALNFHTEVVNGYFREERPLRGAPVAPEQFALACLRNPNNVRTTVLPLADVLAYLSSEAITVLQQPIFVARSQSSFDREIVIDNIPALVMLKSGVLGIRYSHSKLSPTSTTAAAALAELRSVVNRFDASSSLTLTPGDVLILNNRLCLHGRGEVASTSRFDGTDRWLLRLYGYDDDTLPYLLPCVDRKHVMRVKSTSAANSISV